ncbi:hypothetical protein [Flavobacterium sp. 3HN19-14]|uniref:hypothetical protein n=1 Tax=Flavobacterium sp. 3HN19-14 TaxID=3448133 RepID=UPI003EE155F0
MINLFLRAKHWQLFLLTFVLPIVSHIILMAMLFSELIKYQTPPNPEVMAPFFKIFPLIMLLFTIFQFGWIWSVVIGLQKKLPAGIIMKVRRFKILFFIPLFYIVFLCVFMSFVFDGILQLQHSQMPNPALFIGVFVIFIPLHLGSMFCIFHNIYFAAKTIKIAELQRQPKGDEFIGEFFLTWFFPVGVWFLQPRINRLSEEIQE